MTLRHTATNSRPDHTPRVRPDRERDGKRGHRAKSTTRNRDAARRAKYAVQGR